MTVEGFKFFQDAEGFSAFDINAFLMSQSVTRFDNSTDRDTALSSVLTAGMISYDKATGKLQIYDGSSWIDVATGTLTADHGALTGLADDDHTQYHNDARGDARYYTQSQVDTSLAGYLPLSGGTVTGTLTLSQDGQDVLNFSANDTNDARGIAFNSRTALSADYNDGWLRLNQLNEFGNGVYTPGNIRSDGIIYLGSSRGLRQVSGSYGTVQCTGSGAGNWEGFSIDGRAVFMHDGGSYAGLYNDVNNHWMVYCTLNGGVDLRYQGGSKLYTDGSGAVVNGRLHATDVMYVGNNGSGDSNIYFYDDNNNTWRTLQWDDSFNDWRVEDNGGTMRTLYHSGNIPSYLSTSGGTISGSLVVTSTIDANEYYGDNGAANDPSFTFQSDKDTGIYRYTTNQIGFTTGGGYRGRIASDGFHLASGDWFRSYGSTGWYNGTYGGGMYMAGSTYVVVYNSKGLEINKPPSSNYNTASLYLNSNPCSLSFHPGGQAPQMRVGYNNNTIYCRNWADSGWCVVEADVIDRSSRKDKQDISDFKNSAMSLSSATDDTYSRSGLDIALALRPRHYRWDWQTHMRQLPTAERRAKALQRLNNYRESKGLEPFENDELWHVCGRDCDGTADEPCWWVKDWQTGYFGFIAEEVGQVAPEATRFGEENDHTGVKTLAIAAIAVAAIQELSAKVASLEAQLEGA